MWRPYGPPIALSTYPMKQKVILAVDSSVGQIAPMAKSGTTTLRTSVSESLEPRRNHQRPNWPRRSEAGVVATCLGEGAVPDHCFPS